MRIILGFPLTLTLLAFFDLASGQDALTAHERLANTLTARYDRNIIPLESPNDTLKVSFGVAPIHLRLSDEGVLIGRVWLRYVWNDFRLSWDPEEFEGLSVIRVDSSMLWIPDITLYNRYDSEGPMMPYRNRGYYSNALVYSNGEVLLVPDTHISAKCEGINLDDPWAEQTCELKYGSWTFDGHNVDLQLYKDKKFLDLSHYKDFNPVQINKNVGSLVVKTYDCCPEPYPSLHFNVTVQRKWIPLGQGKIERNPKLGTPVAYTNE